MHILRVNNEYLMHMTKALPKIHFTDLHNNVSITLSTVVCDANNERKTNVAIRMSASKKKFLLALVIVQSTIVASIIFGVSSTILVMVPVEAVLFGGFDPITLFRPTLVLLLTLGLNCQRRYILKLLV